MSNSKSPADEDVKKALEAMIAKGQAVISEGERSQRGLQENKYYLLNHQYLPRDVPYGMSGLRLTYIRKIADGKIDFGIPSNVSLGSFVEQLQILEGKEDELDNFESLTPKLDETFTLDEDLGIQIIGKKISKEEFLKNKNRINLWLTESFYNLVKGMEKGRKGKVVAAPLPQLSPTFTDSMIFQHLLNRLEGVDITPFFVQCDAYSRPPWDLNLQAGTFYLVALEKKHPHKLTKKIMVDRLVGDPRVGFWKLQGNEKLVGLGNPGFKGAVKNYVFHSYGQGSSKKSTDSFKTPWTMMEFTLSSIEGHWEGEDLAICTFKNKAWPSAPT